MSKPPVPSDEHATRPANRESMPSTETFRLRLMADSGRAVFVLPRSGTVVLGRGEAADLRVDDTSLSRLHARLHVGRTVQIEDLGSLNGTRVGSRTLTPGERVDVQVGDALEFGRVLGALMLPQGDAAPRRVHTHGYFEARVEDECARGVERAAPFAILRLRADTPAPDDFGARLAASLRPDDVVAGYAPNEYELLLPGATGDDADALARQLIERAADDGTRLRTGIARFPDDGRSPGRLLGKASAVLRPTAPDAALEDMIVQDPAMKALYGTLQRIAQGSINVLLLGETGTGKEVVAARVHALSTRASGPFARLNCATFSDALIESELFGHERGAFTGAVNSNGGILESATGGTVFLDEVGELSPAIQARLLRVLEDRMVRRVGGVKERHVDVRFVAATNRDLEREVTEGRFREDLFFRLNGFSVQIPPLRDRPSEVLPLARRFAALVARQMGYPPPTISDASARALLAHRWPGNIRELRNVMERAVLLADGGEITLEQLPTGRMVSTPPRSEPTVASAPAAIDDEHARILAELEACGGNQSRAAKNLGITRRMLITRLNRYNVTRPRKAT